jgi:diguanylate cyclase (GGDEF)-like protein
MFVAFGCLALAWLVVAVFVARTITGPVDRLRRAVAGVAEGDLTSRVRVEGKDELAGLGRAFNEMTEALQASRQALDQEILERKQAEERIRYLAMHDALTDLPTRRLLSDRMRQALAAARRKKEMVAVLYVDLDGFKQINDRHGHQVGDAVLEEVARRLRSNLRATDTAARVGGDEFAVVLPEITDRGDAALVARKIIESFSRPIVASGGEYAVGASVGVSFYPRDGETLGVLLNEADRAMYKAKKKGGNTIYLAGE